MSNKTLIQNLKNTTIFSTTLAGGTATINAATGALISLTGFTTNGVAAGSIAAGIQSTIGAVQAGSTFATLQSLGALGQGILGASVASVLLPTAIIGGTTYLIYQYRQDIGQASSKFKNTIIEAKLDEKFKQKSDQIKKSAQQLKNKILEWASPPKPKL